MEAQKEHSSLHPYPPHLCLLEREWRAGTARKEASLAPTSVPPEVKTMSSGRPPIILARLCRALPMSSFAFLPAGPDLAAPVGSCHHGAQPKKATWPILFPTCRVGAAGVAPGLAHGIPHGLGHLGGQRSGGVVVQVDPPVGAGAGKGCCGAQGGARGRAGPHPSNESHCASSCSVLAPITAVTVTVSLPSPTWHRGLQICVCPWGIRHLPCLGHHNHPSSSRLPHSHGTHQSAPCCLPHSNGTHQSAHWPLPPLTALTNQLTQ